MFLKTLGTDNATLGGDGAPSSAHAHPHHRHGHWAEGGFNHLDPGGGDLESDAKTISEKALVRHPEATTAWWQLRGLKTSRTIIGLSPSLVP